MDGETQPLLEDTSSGRRKKNAFCIFVFIIGAIALTASIVISYFLYFKYVIGYTRVL